MSERRTKPPVRSVNGAFGDVTLPSGGVGSIAVTFDGGGQVLTASNTTVYRRVNKAGTITKYTVLADASGSVTVLLKKSTYANFPTTADITGGANIVLSTAQKAEDATLSGWTVNLDAGDVLEFTISGTPTVVKRITVQLDVE